VADTGDVTRWNVEDTARLCLAAQEGHNARTQIASDQDLNRSERRKLNAVIEAGERAEHQLLIDNRGFIALLAQRYGRQVNREGADVLRDLVQSASIGFLRAIRSYDPQRGTKLSTLATIMVREEVLAFTRSRWATSGKTAAKQAARVTRLIEPLRTHLGRDPTSEEIARHYNDAAIAGHVGAVAGRPSNAGLDHEQLWAQSKETLAHRGELVSPGRVAELIRMRVDSVSLHRPPQGNRPHEADKTSLYELLADSSPSGRDPADIVADADEHQARVQSVIACMDQLVADNPELGRMLRLRFGYEDGRPHSFPEISRITGIPAPAVQRQLNRALQQLREMAERARPTTRQQHVS
jgi:RNA polymerase primary sigma factor